MPVIFPYRVILLVPVPDEQRDVPVWGVKWDWDHGAVVDSDTSETPSGTLQTKWWEVEEAPNLILDLEIVGPIPTRWYGAGCAENPILPAILSVLDTIPGWNKRPFSGWYDHIWESTARNRPIYNSHKCIIRGRKDEMQKWWPCDEQWLIQAVEHIDDDIVVGGDIHDRARELLVDCNHLKQDTKRVTLLETRR